MQSTITDDHGIDSAYLYYRVNAGSWQQLAMVHQGNDIYLATIPEQGVGSTVDYYLWARDKWFYTTPNIGTDPLGAPQDGYYSFNIFLVGVAEQKINPIRFIPLCSNPTKGNVAYAFSIPYEMNVELIVYDVSGRRVKTLNNKLMKAGTYEMKWDCIDEQRRRVPAGIYFVQFKTDDHTEIEKVILLR